MTTFEPGARVVFTHGLRLRPLSTALLASSAAVNENDLAVTAVLSGNRNFEGRINPDVKMNYLASPPLVVAYALAGTMDFDMDKDPLGTDADGKPVFLADIWPSPQEVSSSSRPRSPRRCSPATTPMSSPATTTGAAWMCRRATPSPGTKAPPTSPTRRTSLGCPQSPRRSRTFTVQRSWRSWATR